MGLSDPLITFRRVPARAGFDRTELERFAETLNTRVARGRGFHCLITGDADLRRWNREFLHKDYPTDVLSFPAAGATLGDLAISRHRAARQAVEFGHTLSEELKLLMLHGVLHLTGLDHERDLGEMARTEHRWRVKLGLSAGLTERSKAAR
jgi:probable rRNA maturation factor